MNSRNSWTLSRLAWIAIIALEFLSHLIFQWFGWSGDVAFNAELVVLAILVLILGPASGALVYFGLSRVPARARIRELKQQRSAIVLDADMDAAFRRWIGTRADRTRTVPVKVSRFGVALTADSEGMRVWAGAGRTPVRVASVRWAEIDRILPPKAMDFIGADSPQTAMTLKFVSPEPDLRVLLFIPSQVAQTGQYKDIVQVVKVLEQLRMESTVR
ncbi:hypothetical protein BJQ94_18620 [Cryobacterium sp. SO2]|uniref:hypothetical protein n=1 Tax=Cryobacterium sp. SO2 TaxID=1897060 RepID=UPI00223DCBCA|nr:hypothetical protein [Cryobacterium sp. SO2]WEO77336.1 hypothetical protein BJQ94_18620 [Cryobacterium sp. SO2]